MREKIENNLPFLVAVAIYISLIFKLIAELLI